MAQPLKSNYPFPERRELLGKYVTLTPCDPARDSAELFEAANTTPEARALWEFMFAGPFESARDFESYLAGIRDDPKALPFTVRRSSDGKAIGQNCLLAIETLHGRAELGSIWYLPEAQRTPANTETCFLLLCHLFDDLGYRRAEWKCDSNNARSFAAAERLGFTFEGTFRHHAIRKGVNRDTAWLSIIDSEWPTVKQRLEKLLQR
jgi:RimJ/RimL family protein N-acetyltransferase